MSSEAVLTIRSWRNLYTVAPDHPAPEELRGRLDALVERDVLDACRRCLAPFIAESDPSVWLIRSLVVDLAIDTSSYSIEKAAGSWGEQLAREIRDVLDGCGSGAAIRFENPVSYVAQWARDMASGCAWEQWYYSEFDSLRSLPRSAAIVEGILREKQDAPAILLQLYARGGLEPILAVLSGGDARRLFHGLLPPDAAAPGRWVARLLTLWNRIPLSFASDSASDAIRLFAAAASEWTAGGFAGLRSAIDGLVELRRVVSSMHPPQMAHEFLEASVKRDYEAARRILRSNHLSAANWLFDFVNRASDADPAWAGFAASVIDPAAAHGGTREESFLTELGGIFLLGPAWSALKIAEALRAAAATCPRPEHAEAILCHLLAVRCLGWPRTSLAISDPGLLAFAALAAAPPLGEMAEILAAADHDAALRILEQEIEPADGDALEYFAIGRVFPELQLAEGAESAWSRIASAVLSKFARGLPGFSRSSPEYIFQNFLWGTSSVRTTAGRIEVRLAYSPLAVVLRIGGAYRRITLPWQEGIEICLLGPAD